MIVQLGSFSLVRPLGFTDAGPRLSCQIRRGPLKKRGSNKLLLSRGTLDLDIFDDQVRNSKKRPQIWVCNRNSAEVER